MRANHSLPADAVLLQEFRAGAPIKALATTYGVMHHTISRHLDAALASAQSAAALTTGGSAPEWHQSAACADRRTPGDLFYPEPGSRPKQAKAVCAGCPVRTDCLRWALDNDEAHGIWGGLSPQERHALVRAGGDR